MLNASGVSGREAAAGWGGDRYVAWRDGDETCVRTTVAMDTSGDEAQLRVALVQLAAARKGEGVRLELGPRGRGPTTFTSCG